MQEKVAALETEAEELRKIRKMLESKLYEPATAGLFIFFLIKLEHGSIPNFPLI